MKNQIKKMAAVALLVASCSYATAQIPTTPNVPPANADTPGLLPPLVPGGPLRQLGRQPGRDQMLQTLTTISGKVTGYTTNDRYAYNGLTLQGSNGTTTVRFPEHLGQQLMNSAKKGETITVKGFNTTGPDGITAFQLVTATAGGVQINDTPLVPPAQPVTPEAKTYTSNISTFKRDPQGMINGLNLDNKVVVDLPPPATAQLQSLLKAGDKVEVSGFKDTPRAGVVLAADAPILIHPQIISLNGQTYLLQ